MFSRDFLRRRRPVAVLAAMVMIIGAVGAGTVASGAWFTATKSTSASVTGALLSIGEIGKTSDQKTISVTDVYPMTDAQAAASARSEWITVRNTGTIPLDWTMAIVNPQAVAPLTSAQLANFRFQLFDDQGAKLTDALSLGTMPAAAQPDTFQTQGAALAAGAQKKVEIKVWLSTDAGNELQGARASFDVVINALQQGAPVAPVLRGVQLAAAPTGSPAGTSTALSWTQASSPNTTFAPDAVTYTVERSTSASFDSAETVYSGSGTSFSDTAGARQGTATDIASSRVTYGGGSYAVIGGTVYGWGDLVIGGSSTSAVALAGFPSGVVQLAVGASHLCARTAAEAVYCVGSDSYGQLGDGAAGAGTTSARPIAVTSALTGERIIDIAAADQSTCVLTARGIIACWGDNSIYQLGYMAVNGALAYSATPRVFELSSGTPHAGFSSGTTTGIAGGNNNFCATRSNGVYCWGSDAFGQVSGNGASTPNYRSGFPTPQQFTGAGTDALDVNIGWQRICAVTAGHKVVCAGHYTFGSLGDGRTVGNGSSGSGPVQALGTYDRVVVGQAHVCAWSSTAADCWGWGEYGQLGSGDRTASNSSPRAVTGLTGATIRSMSAGYHSTCALLTDGTVKCFGDNGSGRAIAATTSSAVTVPTAVTGLSSLGCMRGSLLAQGTCSLEPGTVYHYRVTYTVAGSPGTSPAATATRAEV